MSSDDRWCEKHGFTPCWCLEAYMNSDRRYEGFDTNVDHGDENDYEWEDTTLIQDDDIPHGQLYDEPYDENRHREEVTAHLINNLQEYLEFSTMRDLIRLINENI